MTFPNLQSVVTAFRPGTLSSPISGVAQVDQSFGVQAWGWSEVDANGIANGVPLGQSGPFLLEIGSEQILCVADAGGVITVFDDEGVNGRAYNSSAIAVHAPGNQVVLLSTSVQSEIGGGGGGGGTTLMLYYNAQGPFEVPIASLPAGYSGGIATMLAQLTTGPSLISGLLDVNGDAIPDGWSFPAIIFVEGSYIYDIIMLNDYTYGPGGGWAWYGSGGGQPSLAIGSQGLPNLQTGYGNPLGSIGGEVGLYYLDMSPGGSGLSYSTGPDVNDWATLGSFGQGGLSFPNNGPGAFSAVLATLGSGQYLALSTESGEVALQDGFLNISLNNAGQSNTDVTLFVYAGNPNGNVTPFAVGDLCLDPTDGAIWTAANTGDTAWTLVNTRALTLAVSGNAVEIPVTTQNAVVTNDADAAVTLTLDLTYAAKMQKMTVQFYDYSAAAQALTWVNTENSTVSVPSTSNGSTTEPLTVGFIFNAVTNLWRCVAVV
jgi:hypothetical protein